MIDPEVFEGQSYDREHVSGAQGLNTNQWRLLAQWISRISLWQL